ncbi:MAG: T9SS type A sorting domain-containing protein [Bacteroidales bacterium]|nr:T9SS type A sorting domain-containing protein [Bacteroidales bacterium]
MKTAFKLFLLILFPWFAEAQSLETEIFRATSPQVFDKSGNSLSFPFAGGINNAQYGAIDLDLDGTKDLLVFDRHGNRLLCFLNEGTTNTIAYQFHPEFASQFPEIREWIILHDFNHDGKEDIFTYTTGGIKVFRNDSELSLRFTQITFPYLVSYQGSTYSNILVTYADYPGIADVDGDGDTDILSFKGLGSFIEWHRNLSMDLYGIPDSLIYERSSNCWGRFAEAGESNIIQLDTCLDFKNATLKNGAKHTGSTLLPFDYSGDGLMDLVLGDVDYPSLVYLTNGGTSEDAEMISQTLQFPNPDNPVFLPSFPAACLVDVNNDLQKDLLVSCFDPGLLRSESSRSSWLYLNEGTQSFEFISDAFLQNQMIDLGSGAYPTIFDVNQDGLPDLVIGNYGILDTCIYSPETGLQCTYISSLCLLENIGTLTTPSFRMIDTDYLGLSELKMQSLIPTFGDLDGDGDADLLCGNSKGKFIYLENTAPLGQPAEFILNDPAYRQLDVGDFSAPQIFDLDSDGLNDIISGKRDGRICYFRNEGPVENPQFLLVTDSLGGIDVTNTSLSYFGYSVPHFYRNSYQKLYLLVGSEFGEVFIFDDIMQHLDGQFPSLGTLRLPYQGWRTGLTTGNLNGDTVPDLLIGNYSGGLGYFEGLYATLGNEEPQAGRKQLSIFPNPSRKEEVMVEIPGIEPGSKVSIEIHHINGVKILEKRKTELPFKVDTRDWNAGIYIVSVYSSTKLYSGKMVVLP